jgi:hypothetical protein
VAFILRMLPVPRLGETGGDAPILAVGQNGVGEMRVAWDHGGSGVVGW